MSREIPRRDFLKAAVAGAAGLAAMGALGTTAFAEALSCAALSPSGAASAGSKPEKVSNR